MRICIGLVITAQNLRFWSNISSSFVFYDHNSSNLKLEGNFFNVKKSKVGVTSIKGERPDNG